MPPTTPHIIGLLAVLLLLTTAACGGDDAPPSEIQCQNQVCDAATEICVLTSDIYQTTYECKKLPAACADTPRCSCLAQTLCSTSCQDCNDTGDHTITCSCGSRP